MITLVTSSLNTIDLSTNSWEVAVSTEAGVLKKLSLAGLAKQSRLRYSSLRFGLASAGYSGLGVHDRLVYKAGILS